MKRLKPLNIYIVQVCVCPLGRFARVSLKIYSSVFKVQFVFTISEKKYALSCQLL